MIVAKLPWNEDVAEILGRPNFACGGIAQCLRLSGQHIPTKAEAEQAAVIYWLLGIYSEHGAEWRNVAERRLRAITSDQAGAATGDSSHG